ncbi:MAG: hypothetical protein ACREMZ_15990 [Gemmatimonadales bacterium]
MRQCLVEMDPDQRFRVVRQTCSTFKVVSTLALLRAGVTADQTVPCPKYATVEGRRFQNDLRSHSWFIGWQRDVAFAALVLDGGSNASTAVPLTDRFLTELHR